MKRPFAWLVLVLLLSACLPAGPTAVPTGTATPAGQLTPYLTPTVTLAVTPAKAGKTVSPTPLPSPSPTPRIYTIKPGDTVGGIALAYGVNMDAILSANPQLNPNLMVVGATLVVPASPAAQTPAGDLPTATPLPVRLDGLHCRGSAGWGGLVFCSGAQPAEKWGRKCLGYYSHSRWKR